MNTYCECACGLPVSPELLNVIGGIVGVTLGIVTLCLLALAVYAIVYAIKDL